MALAVLGGQLDSITLEGFSNLNKFTVLRFCDCSKVISKGWVDAELCLLPTVPADLPVIGDLSDNLEPFSMAFVHSEQHRKARVSERRNLEGVKAALPGWSSWGSAVGGQTMHLQCIKVLL